MLLMSIKNPRKSQNNPRRSRKTIQNINIRVLEEYYESKHNIYYVLYVQSPYKFEIIFKSTGCN